MAGLTAQHWLTPDWDPHLTIAQLSLPHLTAHGLKAAVIDVDRTLLPGRDVTLPGPVRDWLVDAGRRLQLHLFSNNPSAIGLLLWLISCRSASPLVPASPAVAPCAAWFVI